MLSKLFFVIKLINKKFKKFQQIEFLKSKFSCFIDSNVEVYYDSIEDLSIEKDVYISNYCFVTVINENKENRISKLSIGENTSFGEFCDIRAGGGVIEIGRNCLIAQNVKIIGANHLTNRNILIRENGWDQKKNFVVVGDDVWIGCNAVILPGVKIGTGSVIAAGSIVTKDILPYTIVAGNPAKFLKNR